VREVPEEHGGGGVHDVIVDRGVQLDVGDGYVAEYPIARADADARITRT
jgi:alkylation response protein AidB-like acyl-CoA dehydrogenase